MATSNARFEKVFESSEEMRLKVVASEQLEWNRARDRGFCGRSRAERDPSTSRCVASPALMKERAAIA